MPHQCTNCGRTFPDGSKEMLSGCPDCSGTKFQFQPDGFGDDGDDTEAATDDAVAGDVGERSPAAAADGTSDSSTPGGTDSTADTRDRPGVTVTRTVGSAAATVRDLVSGSAGRDATAATPRSESGTTSTTAKASDDSRGADGSHGADDSPTTVDSPGATDSHSTTDSHIATDSHSATDAAETGGSDDDIIVAECEPVDDGEDAAQADARSSFASADEVPESDGFDPAADAGDAEAVDAEVVDEGTEDDDAVDRDSPAETNGDLGVDRISVDGSTTQESGDAAAERTAVAEPDAERTDRPELAELREELNEQFESIRVVEPGQYELNLMELYDREEYIIALQEDGRYSIQVPETWRDGDS